VIAPTETKRERRRIAGRGKPSEVLTRIVEEAARDRKPVRDRVTRDDMRTETSGAPYSYD